MLPRVRVWSLFIGKKKVDLTHSITLHTAQTPTEVNGNHIIDFKWAFEHALGPGMTSSCCESERKVAII